MGDMGEPLTDEQIAEEEKFLAGLPRVNLGALFLAPVWGPAHGMWAAFLFFVAWLFADNVIYAATVDPTVMNVVLAVLMAAGLVAATVVFAIVAQPFAAHRAENMGVNRETYLRREIYLWEHAQADRIFRPYLPVPKAVEITSVGLNVREEERGKESGGIYSHRYENQLKDDEDLAKLRDPEVKYDHAETMRRFSKAAEAVGDILPVKLMGLETGYGLGLKTWDDVVMLMGPEQLFYELCDRPEFLHRIARRFCDIFVRLMQKVEQMGLLEADQLLVHSTPALSDDLRPGRTGAA